MQRQRGDGHFEFTRIFVFDAVPETENQTTPELVQRINEALPAGSDQITTVHRCNSVADVFRALDSVVAESKDGVMPLLHLDGHGSKDGFNTADRGLAGWEEIFQRFRAINQACGNNLFVSMGACEAAHSFRHSTLAVPCPVHALLASAKLLPISEAKEGICLFYEKLLSTGKLDDAYQAIKDYIDPPRLAFISTRHYLEKAMLDYVANHCAGEGLARRRAEILAEVQKKGSRRASLMQHLQRKSATRLAISDQKHRTFCT